MTNFLIDIQFYLVKVKQSIKDPHMKYAAIFLSLAFFTHDQNYCALPCHPIELNMSYIPMRPAPVVFYAGSYPLCGSMVAAHDLRVRDMIPQYCTELMDVTEQEDEIFEPFFQEVFNRLRDWYTACPYDGQFEYPNSTLVMKAIDTLPTKAKWEPLLKEFEAKGRYSKKNNDLEDQIVKELMSDQPDTNKVKRLAIRLEVRQAKPSNSFKEFVKGSKSVLPKELTQFIDKKN